jgi:hypothetical protein
MVETIDFDCPFGITADTIPPVPRGDKIAAIAQPIARAIDRVAGTKLAKCGGCKQMRSDLNAGMPFAKALRKRFQRRKN